MVKFKLRKFKNNSYFITVPKVYAEQLISRGRIYAEWQFVGLNTAIIKFKTEGY